MRILMILAPLAALVLASCTSSSSGTEEAATPEDAYRALDEMALDLFTEIAPGTEVKSTEP